MSRGGGGPRTPSTICVALAAAGTLDGCDDVLTLPDRP
jgi:hypothetical protein